MSDMLFDPSLDPGDMRAAVRAFPEHLAEGWERGALAEDFDIDALTSDLEQLRGVVDVHDLHVWTLTSEMDAASAHLMTAPDTDAHHVLDQARQLLSDSYGIAHGTFQVEPDTHTGCHEVSW